MEYLIFAVILYFILQTAGNLVYILRGGAGSESTADSRSMPDGWDGPSPRRHTEGITDHPTFWGDDIEEATWRDLDKE
jgi:hypothetical protein